MSADSPTPNREVAYRLFAAEFEDAAVSHTESDEERAPNYVIAPTGARINRLFVVGTLTEISSVNEQMLRARIVDPTGAFVVYAGQYQPDELAVLEQLEPPAFVAVTGKARTFEPDDSDRVFTSIRPESIATVDAATRDSWVVDTAEQTVDRVGTYAAAAESGLSGSELRDALDEAGVDEGFAQGIALAQAEYGTTPAYLEGVRDLALESARVIAGEQDEVSGLEVSPDETRSESETYESLARVHGQGIDIAEAPRGEKPKTDSSTAESVETTSGSQVEVESADARAGTAEASSAVEVGSSSDPSDSTDSIDSTDSTDSEESAVLETTSESESIEPDSIENGSGTDVDLDSTGDADSESASDIDSGEGIDPDDTDDLGDFDADGFDDGMYEMDDEEREELEAEFGAEFSTGSEVDEPGTAEIDVSDDDGTGSSEYGDDAALEPESDTESVSELGSESATDLEGEPEPEPEPTVDDESSGVEEASTPETEIAEPDEDGVDSETADQPENDVDVQSRVIETMNRLDDGDGADRAAVVEAVSEETGIAAEDVEDAIQEALMGGQCYEPDDETLKAI